MKICIYEKIRIRPYTFDKEIFASIFCPMCRSDPNVIMTPMLLQSIVVIGRPLAQAGRPTIDKARQYLQHDDLEGALRYWVTLIYSEPGLEPLKQQWLKSRMALPPETVRSFFDPDPEMALESHLHAVRVPTLVMHGEQDRNVPIDEGRKLAENIPNSRFTPFKAGDTCP